MNEKEKEVLDNVSIIMSTQLTEKEVLVYLLVMNGWTYRKIAELPFGISYDTARKLYDKAKPKMDRLAELGLFSTEVK